jgi:hypothetical protein
VSVHTESASAFLSLFGAPSVTFTRSTHDRIFGTVSWSDDPSQTQEIAVDTRQRPLSPDALSLAAFVRERRLVHSDRLTLGREALREVLLADDRRWTAERYGAAYDELLGFRVSMIDDGSVTDSFFLHE